MRSVVRVDLESSSVVEGVEDADEDVTVSAGRASASLHAISYWHERTPDEREAHRWSGKAGLLTGSTTRKRKGMPVRTTWDACASDSPHCARASTRMAGLRGTQLSLNKCWSREKGKGRESDDGGE